MKNLKPGENKYITPQCVVLSKIKTIININFILIATFLFYLISFAIISHHEIWRDEGQSFLLVRDSKTIYDLFLNTSCEGHPLLWYIFITPFVKIFDSVKVLQVVHIIISSCSIFIIFKYSQFKKTHKLLLACNYFLLYEYNIFIRNYSLSIFLIFCFAILYNKKNIHKKLFGFILCCLANTSVMGLIFVIGFIIAEIISLIFKYKTTNLFDYSYNITGVAGVIVAVFQISRAGVANNIHLECLYETENAIFNSFFPLPNLQISFWQSNIILENEFTVNIFYFLFLLISAIYILRLSEYKELLALYILIFLGYLLFFNFVYPCSIYHSGFIFISFIAIELIYRELSKMTNINKLKFSKVNDLFGVLFTFLLTLQAFSGVVACMIDYKQEFSGAYSTAKFIKSIDIDNMQLSFHPDYISSGVLAYSGIKNFYSPQIDRYISFIKWCDYKKEKKSLDDLLENMKNKAKDANSDLIVVSHTMINNNKNIDLIFRTEPQIRDDETMFVYLIKNKTDMKR